MIQWLDDTAFPNFPIPSDEFYGHCPIALGGRVSPLWLDQAYRLGLFPWNSPKEMRQWWSPTPRAVITPASYHLPKTVAKLLRKPHQVTSNLAFTRVMQACAAPRDGQAGTWISQEMIQSYSRLHQAGRALSVELWNAQGDLVGGFYGLLIGHAFFGESMFSKESNAPKIAFATAVPYLWQAGIEMIDCQMETPHLAQFGLLTLNRADFHTLLKKATAHPAILPLPSLL